jgi:acyl carrier protein
MTIKKRIISIIADDLRLKPESISNQSHLVNDLAVGSLDVVYILMNLEDEFKIVFDETTYSSVTTIQDVINLVTELLKK